MAEEVEEVIEEDAAVEEEDEEVVLSYPYTNECSFQQSSGVGDFPVVSSIASDTTTITLTGTNFLTTVDDGFVAMVQVAGVNADTVTINSNTEVVAEWEKGVPPISEGSIAIWFETEQPEEEGGRRLTEVENTEIEIYFGDSSTIVFDNPLSISSDADVTCSFAGGCTY